MGREYTTMMYKNQKDKLKTTLMLKRLKTHTNASKT